MVPEPKPGDLLEYVYVVNEEQAIYSSFMLVLKVEQALNRYDGKIEWHVSTLEPKTPAIVAYSVPVDYIGCLYRDGKCLYKGSHAKRRDSIVDISGWVENDVPMSR